MKVALISGTSGLIGMQLLHFLLKNPAFDYVLSVGRRSLALKHSKLIQLEGDLSKIQEWDWPNAINQQSLDGGYQKLVRGLESNSCEVSAFSALGTTIKNAGSRTRFFEIDHDLVIGFAAWAKNLGTHRFHYVSASGADADSSIFYNKVKGQTELDLDKVGFDRLIIYQPSLLLGNRTEFRFGELVAKVLLKPLVWFRLFKNFRPIYDYQVAKTMVHIDLIAGQKGLQRVSSGEMQDLSKDL